MLDDPPMKKPALIIIIALLLLAPLLSSYNASATTTAIRNVSISIEVLPSVYDDFITWIQPHTQNFSNFTIIIMQDNNSYDWYLNNQTRINQLAKIGEVIPGIGYLQTKSPQDRISFLNQTLLSWRDHVGYMPSGFFMFQPDTLTINFLKSQGVTYFLGYCFDQYQIDWMSMRGGWQLPYYASQNNALMPESQTESGVVVLPWLTWDWIDSFTVSHNYNTHPVDTAYISVPNSTAYILNLIKANLGASSPVAYSAFSFEYNWIKSLNFTDKVSAILDNIINDDSYAKLSCGNFTQWFKKTYATTPNYRVNFTSSHSNQSVEWFFDVNSRIARLSGKVVSYVNYQNQAADKYLTKAAADVDFNQARTGNHPIDTSLTFTIDALGGGEFRAPSKRNGITYSGDLADFPAYLMSHPTPVPTQPSTSIPNENSFQPLYTLAYIALFCSATLAILVVKMKYKPTKLKSKHVAALLLVIILLSLVLSLRGVAPKTYLQTEVPVSAIQTAIVSYDYTIGANWSVHNFASDIGNWSLYSEAKNVLYVDGKALSLVATLGNTPQTKFVRLTRDLDINILELPIFSMNISVSKGAVYHIRFEGRDSTGANRRVWWETSPLDDLPGKSTWEINAVDLAEFSKQAVGEVIPTITSIQVILDMPSNQVEREKTLSISSMRFSERNLKNMTFSGDATIDAGSQPFQALILDVPSQFMPKEGWNLLFTSVTYRLTSNAPTEYSMILLSKDNGALINGPTFVSHEASLTDIYKIELLSSQYSRSQQLTFVSSLTANYSIIIFKNSWDEAGFSTFALDSVEIASSRILNGGG